MPTEQDKKFILKTIEAAEESARRGDFPIGAIIVKDGEIISIAHETLKSANDPVNGHAEIAAIREACKKLEQPYLEKCTLYSSHEPCPMCATASFWAKLDKIVFSVSREDMIAHMEKQKDSKFSWRQVDISCQEVLDKGMGLPKKIDLIGGVLREEGLRLFDL